jgi:hypothetical protein
VARFLIILFSLWLCHTLAQVTYSSTPTPEDLEEYFYGGLKIVNLVAYENTSVRYQFIDARTMNVLEVNNGGIESGYVHQRIRLVLSFSTSGGFYCGESIDNRKQSVFTLSVQTEYGDFDNEIGSLDSSQSKGSTCISFNKHFNLGHWTDIIANSSTSLPYNQWIPVTAFIPNYNDQIFTYAPASEWFVLLILFDDGTQIEPQLDQEGLIQRIRDYGINPNP